MSKNQEIGKAFDYKLFSRVFGFSKRYLNVLITVVISGILSAAFAVFTPVVVQYIINWALDSKNHDQLLTAILVMATVLLAQVIFQLLFNYFANLLGESVIKDLRIQLFRKMMAFKMTYFDKSSLGVLVTRAVADMQRIGEIFSQGFFVIVADVLKMVAATIVMFYMNWRLTLIVFAILPIILIATRLFQRAMKVAFVDVRAQVSNLNSFVQERIAGMKIVQLFTREDIEKNKFRIINKKHRDAWLKTVWYNSIFFPVAEISNSIGIGLVVYFGVIQQIEAVSDSVVGTIVAFFFLMELLFRPLRQIADKFNTLQMGMVAANRVFKILDTDEHIVDRGTISLPKIKGAIEFSNVHFGYAADEEVLHGLSFNAEAGENIAIVGATGAGKSTIINLLNRFYEIDSGSILIDGVNTKDFKLNALRSQIAIVLQDVFLFADTIANNISLKDENILLHDIKNAAKDIGVHEFIESLPGGYAYNVKERGTMLSSGQRQLIAFLRAYVRNPGILILDEATSSVDTYTEQLIQKAINKITEGRTSIIIAHRLATIKKADKILVIEAGQIVETGSHRQLLEKSGYYSNLYQAQFVQEEII